MAGLTAHPPACVAWLSLVVGFSLNHARDLLINRVSDEDSWPLRLDGDQQRRNMVSYNPLAMYPKSHCANLYPGTNPWYSSNYQPPTNVPLFAAGGPALDADGGAGAGPQPPLYYPHMFHQGSSPDWHDTFSTPPSVNGALIQAAASANPPGGLGAAGNAGHHQHHHLHSHHHHHPHQGPSSSEHLTEGLHSIPSPPITVSGSEMSSPGGGGGGPGNNSASSVNGLHGVGGGGGLSPPPASHHNMSIRPVPVKSPFEWIKRTSYQNQTNPGEWRVEGEEWGGFREGVDREWIWFVAVDVE